jgi:hypothetical protein
MQGSTGDFFAAKVEAHKSRVEEERVHLRILIDF